MSGFVNVCDMDAEAGAGEVTYVAALDREEALAIVQSNRGRSKEEAGRLAKFLSSSGQKVKVFKCSITAQEENG